MNTVPSAFQAPNLWRRGIASIAALTAASVLLAGCAKDESEQFHPGFDSTGAVDAGPTPTAGETVGAAQTTETSSLDQQSINETQVLMQADAPINIIYIDTASPSARKLIRQDSPDGEAKRINKQLRERDPKIRNAIRRAFVDATDGRYVPEKVSITKAKAIKTGECILSHDGREEATPEDIQRSDATEARIQKIASMYVQPDAINVAYVNVLGCTNPGFQLAGYASSDTIPVLLRSGFGDEHVDTATHEVGHKAGLGHAAKMICQNRVHLQDCVSDPTGDPDSTMGYKDDAEDSGKYSVPELGKLGLLNDKEVLANPADGNYKLAQLDEPGVKLIKLDTEDGIIHLSWEDDYEAAYDLACKPGYEIDTVPRGDVFYYGSSTDDAGRENEWFTYKSRTSHQKQSLQVRLEAEPGVLSLIPREPADDSACPGILTNVENIEQQGWIYKGKDLTGNHIAVRYLGAKNGSPRIQIKTIG